MKPDQLFVGDVLTYGFGPPAGPLGYQVWVVELSPRLLDGIEWRAVKLPGLDRHTYPALEAASDRLCDLYRTGLYAAIAVVLVHGCDYGGSRAANACGPDSAVVLELSVFRPLTEDGPAATFRGRARLCAALRELGLPAGAGGEAI